MIIHPKIQHFITMIHKSREAQIDDKDAKKLWQCGATATEAAITLHLGFNFSLADAEKYIKALQLWKPEEIQDIAYQTFLYMNYSPDDPNFSYDENNVRFPL